VSYGFVYILKNGSMPGIYKVGYTERSPSLRCEELSRSTSVPQEFELICYAEFRNAHAKEQEIHRQLEKHRVNPDREFFRCDLLLITRLVMEDEDAMTLCDHDMDLTLYHESSMWQKAAIESGRMSEDGTMLRVVNG
jgi:hypothetical protein